MCCFFAALVLIGPRFAILLWWLFDHARWSSAFESFMVGFIGFLLVPWTTMAYVLVAQGGVTGFDWVILALGVLSDVGSTSGGRWSDRRRRRGMVVV